MPFFPDMSLPLKTCISGCSFAHPLDLKWLKVGFLRDSATLVCLNKVIVTLLLEAFQLCVCAVTFLYYSNCGMCFCNTVLAHYVCLHVLLLPWCWHEHVGALFSVFKCSLSSLLHSYKPPPSLHLIHSLFVLSPLLSSICFTWLFPSLPLFS